MSIGLAILGAGDFVRDEHLPALKTCPLFTLRAIYSSSREAAQLVSQDDDIERYFDRPATPLHSLEDLLARQDIRAVIIAVPLCLQSGLIKKALSAGKHVLSEKPIAEDVRTAESLIEWYRGARSKEIWSVAENFRFIPGIKLASAQLKEIGGRVVSFSLNIYGFIHEESQRDQVSRRPSQIDQRKFIVDSGVHFTACLRALLHAAGQEILSLTAFTSLVSPHLQPIDTIHSILRLRNGTNGTFNISFGTEFKTAFEMEIVTHRGSVTVKADRVICITKDKDGKLRKECTELEYDNGVRAEVDAFARSIEGAVADERGTPEQAFADLRLIYAMLESGEQGGAVISL